MKIVNKNELTDKIGVVVGTRPGIIKFSPVIRYLNDNKMPFFIVHTGQHYSPNMDRLFFEELEIPFPDYINKNVTHV